jgi:hypothetical protein
VKKLISLVVILMLAGTALADSAKVGSSGAQFLRIGVGSRYQGMAETAVATVNDVYAMYWNPAGMADVDNWEVGFTNVNWLLDINLNYAAMAHRFEDIGVFGASVAVLSTGEQETTTILEHDGTGDTYTATSYAIGLSFARQLTNRFAFGMTGKLIGEKIGVVSSRGIAFDFGTMLYTGFQSLRMGMSITNMGADMKFSGNGLEVPYNDSLRSDDSPVDAELSANPYSLPLMFRIGLAYDFAVGPKSVLTCSGEIRHPNDNERQASMGAQYAFDNRFYLRGGYKFNYDEETLALGGGLRANVGQDTRLLIDYSWQDFGRLESTQRFSVGFAF